MMAGAPFSLAIIAGGQSRRMGRDKAFIEIGGKSLIERIIAASAELGQRETVLIANQPGGLSAVRLADLPRHPAKQGLARRDLHGAEDSQVGVDAGARLRHALHQRRPAAVHDRADGRRPRHRRAARRWLPAGACTRSIEKLASSLSSGSWRQIG